MGIYIIVFDSYFLSEKFSTSTYGIGIEKTINLMLYCRLCGWYFYKNEKHEFPAHIKY